MSEHHRAEPEPTVDVTPPAAELREVNERLLLAGLRQQEQAVEAERLTAVLEHRTLHDPLTDLPNRALLADRLGQAILAAGREGATFALLFLDLDRFKAINDRLGHHAGDLVLQGVARRLCGALRGMDTVARIHGDEFVVLLPWDDATAAEGVARKLRHALAPPFMLQGRLERVEASIGIAVYPAHGADADALLRRADAAMYRAKRARSGQALAESGEDREVPADDATGPTGGGPVATGPTSADEELQAVNERLLLAGLREQELSDQLRHQLAFTSAIADNLGEGVCALDRACRFTFANPEAGRLLGWAEADLLGRDWNDVVHRRHIEGCPLVEAVHLGVAHRDDDTRFARRDGGTFAAAYSAAPVVADGAVVGVVVVFRDITARQHAEAERAALLARVEAALAFRTRFIAITAHELKSPLTTLKGYAQLLLRRPRQGDDDRLLRSLGTIDQQVDRMARLIDDLSDVARIEGDGLAHDPHPLDLRTLLAEAVAEVGMGAPDFALRLQAEGAEGEALRVHGDRTRLQQVLINLLTNAVKYSGQRREADIAIRREGDRAVATVADYGIGIPAAQQAAVFEPYVRGTNAATGGASGAGLGLFISRAIVDRHGGTLDFVSEEGRGSTFSLALPLLPGAATPAAAPRDGDDPTGA